MSRQKTIDKIEVLGQSAQYDICCTQHCLSGRGGLAARVRGKVGRWIYPAAMPNGETILLLKVLMSNECSNDCYYCVNRCSSAFRRTSFKPEELVRLFLELRRRELARGLFLSSAVLSDPDTTMDRMLTTVEALRKVHRFDGFVHMKILPGASFDRVERAAQLADRISVNVEAPNAERLKVLSPDKDFETDIGLRMKWISRLCSRSNTRCKGHTTQFVIGAAGETDAETLRTTSALYSRLNLSRAYFSAFQPVEGSPLSDVLPTPLLREHRLYQADFLLRRYGFTFGELEFSEGGNLSLDADPKKVWATNHPEFFPVEVNTAAKQALLRVPGIGPKAARRIVKMRAAGRIRSANELKSSRLVLPWAAPYITVDGKLLTPRRVQLALW